MNLLELLKSAKLAAFYAHIDKEAEKEVGIAKQFSLKDENGTDQFHKPRFLLAECRADAEIFETLGLKILPTDVFGVLFRCKLLFATKSEHEFRQRGGGGEFFANSGTLPKWTDRAETFDAVVEKYLEGLNAETQKRTLLTHISCYTSMNQIAADSPQAFFDDLFKTMGLPFECYFEDLVKKHQVLEGGLPNYSEIDAKRFFSGPSFGCSMTGSREYCFWNASIWLRTFLNMLRIAGYIYPGQREFTIGVEVEPPTFPVFLGEHAQGCLAWDQDKKESSMKLPDGCLFRSFGFRGTSKMWLDRRNFASIKEFMGKHKIIFDNLKNPWASRNVGEVAPTLDILSSATQIPDLGAKILLIYTCLEHLFVPPNAGAENSKYIVGGLSALNQSLVQWFSERLYRQRNAYAHKGFVIRGDKTSGLIVESMNNVMWLLAAKLAVPAGR